jgi:hypothetical protein
VHLLDAGNRLGLPDRVDGAAVAARGQDDQPTVIQMEGGRDLVPELVREQALALVGLCDPVGITAERAEILWSVAQPGREADDCLQAGS